MEADLLRFYGIDYRDRWRTVDGRRVLTLRRLWNLWRHLPSESACALILRDGLPHWSLEAHLLDDLRITTTGSKKNPSKPHPMRPDGKKKRRRPDDPTRKRKVAAAKRRAAERRARLAAAAT